jgi:hypothetical protein
MAKRRGNNEGNITKRTDGRWMARMSVGRDPKTGKLQRVTFYGKTRQDVADQLIKALHDKQQGTFVARRPVPSRHCARPRPRRCNRHCTLLGAFSLCGKREPGVLS